MEGVLQNRVCLFFSLLAVTALSLLLKPTTTLLESTLDTGYLITEEKANLSKTVKEYRLAYDD
ncbi:MAG: hypothetical protein KDK72_05870 [Chlamydiia bacterium]|nr:hypothetical protein [Chlamydiia bacterium]